MGKYKATRLQRLMSDIRYMRYMLPDIAAGLAMVGLVLMVTVIGSIIG